MKVVSNASPLINLARIGHLALLNSVYGRITIPEAVWHEVVVAGAGKPGAQDVRSATWLSRQPVSNQALVNALRQDLDAGEAEAIALATELKADLLLMDERLARETAQHLGVRCVGLLGTLVIAKRQGVISQARPYLDALRDIAGFRVSDAPCARLLHDVGE